MIVPADYPLGEATARIVFKTDSGTFGAYDFTFTVVPALKTTAKPAAKTSGTTTAKSTAKTA